MTYDACTMDARVACTPYCFQFLIRISGIALLLAPLSSCYKQKRKGTERIDAASESYSLLFVAALHGLTRKLLHCVEL